MSNELIADKSREEMSLNKVLALTLSAVLAPMVLLFFVWGKNPKFLKTRETLQQIAAETPLYPDFKELNSSSIIKDKHGILSFYYDTPAFSAGFDAVKKFYTEALIPKGWSLIGERTYGWNPTVKVEFRKGKYSIYLYYSEGGAEGWDYAISYAWDE